jgi:hypothetical protein
VRERPEHVAPGLSHLAELSPKESAMYEVVDEAVRQGLAPDYVAGLVHDAVVNNTFWIFPHPDMVQALRDRFASILDGHNPAPRPAV